MRVLGETNGVGSRVCFFPPAMSRGWMNCAAINALIPKLRKQINGTNLPRCKDPLLCPMIPECLGSQNFLERHVEVNPCVGAWNSLFVVYHARLKFPRIGVKIMSNNFYIQALFGTLPKNSPSLVRSGPFHQVTTFEVLMMFPSPAGAGRIQTPEGAGLRPSSRKLPRELAAAAVETC